MLARIMSVVVIVAGVIVAFVGFQIWQEQSYGTGPVITAVAAAGETREIAFVANSVGGTVSLIDVEAREVIGEIDVLPDGKKVGLFRDWEQANGGQKEGEARGVDYVQDTDVSPDGTVLYVARGYIGDVAAFDIATGKLMWRRPVGGNRADHMTLTPDGKRLFVSAIHANRVEAIDTGTGKRVGLIVGGTWPHDNHISADGARLYNASIGDMTLPLEQRDTIEEAGDRVGFAYQLTVIDPVSMEVLERHRFDRGIRPIAITEDATMLYAQQSNRHGLIAYDLKEMEQVDEVDLPVRDGVTDEDWDLEAPHHGLALSPDGETLCVAGRASDYVALVATTQPPLAPDLDDLPSGRPLTQAEQEEAARKLVQALDGQTRKLSLIGTVLVGDAPGWAEITDDGRYCIVANTRSDNVSFVSVGDGVETTRVKTGQAPKHVTLARVPVSVLGMVAGRSSSP